MIRLFVVLLFVIVSPITVYSFSDVHPQITFDNLMNLSDDGYFSADEEDSEDDSEDQLTGHFTPRRVSITLLDHLKNNLLTPDSVIAEIESNNVNISDATKDKIREAFCDPKRFSREFWSELLSDQLTSSLLAIVFTSLVADAPVDASSIRSLSPKIPSGAIDMCYPVWVAQAIATN